MILKNIKKITLKEFLKKKDIKLNWLKNTNYTTLRNILRWKHDWAKYNINYRGKLPYFPTERTMSKLSLELEITYQDLEILIKNQYKSNKKD